MFSTTNVLILLACIAFFAYRAYKRGVWKGLLGLLGLATAYLVSLLLAPTLGKLVPDNGVNGVIAFVGASIAIFFVVSAMVSTVPTFIFPALQNVTLKHRLMGACLGAVTGMLFAVLAIWMVGVMSATLGLKNKSGAVEKRDALSDISSRIVSKALHTGINAIEKDPYKASATAAFFSAPHVFSQSFASLSKSPELKTFWADGKAQFLMAEADIDQLMEYPVFTALVKAPAMQNVLQEGKPKDVSITEAERYFATQMSYVWRRMRDLRSDQRVVKILEDAEVKALIAKQNPAALLANPKVQALIEIVTETPLEESITPRHVETVKVKALPEAPRVIYKWLDLNGKMRYTDYDHTPESERATAEKIVQ